MNKLFRHPHHKPEDIPKKPHRRILVRSIIGKSFGKSIELVFDPTTGKYHYRYNPGSRIDM